MSLADVFGPSEKVTIPANELVAYFRAEARTYAENTAMINGLRANLPADHILIMIGKKGTDCMRKEIIEETSPEPEKEEISIEQMREDLNYHCSHVGECEKCSLEYENTSCEFNGKDKVGYPIISDEDIRKYHKIIYPKKEV